MSEHVAFPQEIREFTEEKMIQQKKVLERAGIKTSLRIKPGVPGWEIPRIAKKEECSLIVVGSHEQGVAREIFLGSTAADIMHRSDLPVLIIRLTDSAQGDQNITAAKRDKFLRNILYATDFSEHSGNAFAYLRELVKLGARHVTLLHVQERARIEKHLSHKLDEFNRIDWERLLQLKQQLNTCGDAEISIEIPLGAPVEEILKRTQNDGTSLVVMGSHGRGFMSEIFQGSVSHNISQHSSAPVLIVPLQKTVKNNQTITPRIGKENES